MSGFRVSYHSPSPAGVAGKLFLSLFFLVFLGMGSLFVWFIARDTAGAVRIWAWQKTSCEILASAVREPDKEGETSHDFEFEVTFRYSFVGKTFTSSRYQRTRETFSDYGTVAELVERYRPGSSAVCYVNGTDPTEAVLVRDNLLQGLTVLFPMIFVAIGAGGLYFTWRRKRARPEVVAPISDRANWAKAQPFLLVFFLIFLLVGCGVLYGLFLRPLAKILAARHWVAVPCTVLSSEIKSHHGGEDGPTYSVNILYAYEFNGREFKANRYHFLGGSSSGYSGKQAIVSRHPPGTRTVCYVNPRAPTQAVLERGLTSDMWFGLIPLVFVAVGAGGLIFVLRKRRATQRSSGPGGQDLSERGSASAAVPGLPTGGSSETLMLKPKVSPLGKLLGMIVVAGFWNGIVSVFVVQAVKSWVAGHPEWFLTIFMIPFVLIGLALIGGIFYSLLALFNPRPRLKVTPGAIPLGGTLRVEWEITGRTDMLENLRVRLEGREEATYRRGTTTSTDKSVFANLEILSTTAAPEIRSGSAKVTIPANLMHSFSSRNNKIIWAIQLHGQIARWPDVKEEFSLTVLPARQTARDRS